jgi:hypothetical protein
LHQVFCALLLLLLLLLLLQGFNLQAMYEDLSTLEIKLNQLLEQIGKKPMSPSPTPGAKPAAADALPAAKAVAVR